MKSPVRLIYAASDHDADMLYATRHFIPDAFLWWRQDGETHAVLSPLEIDRARANAPIDHVHAVAEYLPKSAKRRGPAALIAAVAKKHQFGRIEVPGSFPFGIVQTLRRSRLNIRAVDGEFFPERAVKSAHEIAKIEAALRLAEAGMERAWEVLRASDPGAEGILQWAGAPLTSERLRGEIDATIIQRGGLPAGTIVAGGDQGCDPHERGFGPLRANEPIILDIFPRDQRTGYFGDLTRTVVRGRATYSAQKLYDTVKDGKAWVMSKVKAGVSGEKLQKELLQRFTAAGYPTEVRHERNVGFFHGVGHSLGLEIHEAPRFAVPRLAKGIAMTIEPGLYYPGVGGVRLEDLVIITTKGVDNLTRLPEVLEL